MNQFMLFYLGLFASLIIGIRFLLFLSPLDAIVLKISDWFCSDPSIDVALAYFMLIPLTIPLLVSESQ